MGGLLNPGSHIKCFQHRIGQTCERGIRINKATEFFGSGRNDVQTVPHVFQPGLILRRITLDTLLQGLGHGLNRRE